MSRIVINSSLNERVSAFAKAGKTIASYLSQKATGEPLDPVHKLISSTLKQAEASNTWFTQQELHFALSQWAEALTSGNLDAWLAPYHLKNIAPKTVGIVAAGNIPLVGFHDVLCVILAGHKALVKVSSNDRLLLPMMLHLAAENLPALKESYEFTQGKLQGHDAVIATGSNNTARYFEYYFKDQPSIIRKNRNSIAVLTGNESLADMQALSEDVFRYFGLGCRSVSHLKVPRGFNFDLFFNGMYEQRDLINNKKYLNNYDYNKAVYLMSEFDLLDNEFMLIKEETGSYSSPIATLGYSYYDDLGEVAAEFKTKHEQLQCVVGSEKARNSLQTSLKGLSTPQLVGFGETQRPDLSDYADGVDTIQFLISLS